MKQQTYFTYHPFWRFKLPSSLYCFQQFNNVVYLNVEAGFVCVLYSHRVMFLLSALLYHLLWYRELFTMSTICRTKSESNACDWRQSHPRRILISSTIRELWVADCFSRQISLKLCLYDVIPSINQPFNYV